MLSPSILDHLINNDRKLPPEYNLPHTYVEMQVSSQPTDGSVFVLLVCIIQLQFTGHLHSVQTFACHSLSTICQQSLQIAAFLFTVCHVVIVVQDWFTDLNVYR